MLSVCVCVCYLYDIEGIVAQIKCTQYNNIKIIIYKLLLWMIVIGSPPEGGLIMLSAG